jgi:hypothetical protein
MKEVVSFKMPINIYQTILCAIPEDSNLCGLHNEHLRSHIVLCMQEIIEGLKNDTLQPLAYTFHYVFPQMAINTDMSPITYIHSFSNALCVC